MSETKHTPGPWYWCDGEGDDDLPYLTSQTGIICEFGNCREYYPQCGDIPNKSDRRLIAAAPELLEALELLIANVHSCACTFPTKEERDAWGKAAAAIAKAKGDQP